MLLWGTDHDTFLVTKGEMPNSNASSLPNPMLMSFPCKNIPEHSNEGRSDEEEEDDEELAAQPNLLLKRVLSVFAT